MRTITVCTLTLGLLSTGLALASSATAPATQSAAPPAATTPPATEPPVQIPGEPAPAAKSPSLMSHTAKVTPKIVTVSGEITAVDAVKNLFTVKEANAIANFELRASTHIRLADGKDGHAADVKVGERVSITYDAHGKAAIAKTVKIG